MQRVKVEQKMFFTPFAAVEDDESVQMLKPGDVVAVASVEDRRLFGFATVVFNGTSGSVTFPAGPAPWSPAGG
jgi:hypothetical protein